MKIRLILPKKKLKRNILRKNWNLKNELEKKTTDCNQCFFFHTRDVKILPNFAPKIAKLVEITLQKRISPKFPRFAKKTNTDWNLLSKNFKFRIFFLWNLGTLVAFFSTKKIKSYVWVSCSGFFCGQVRKTYPQKIKWWFENWTL